MIARRPTKFRGAYCYSAATASAITAACCVYQPPATGAVIEFAGADQAAFWGIFNASQLATFTVVGSTDLIAPMWGPEYALTGNYQGGRIQVVQGFPAPLANPSWGRLDVVVFQPNVFVMSNQTINIATDFALSVREFFGAEELERWGQQDTRP